MGTQELYGVTAELVQSKASTPVDTATKIYYFVNAEIADGMKELQADDVTASGIPAVDIANLNLAFKTGIKSIIVVGKPADGGVDPFIKAMNNAPSVTNILTCGAGTHELDDRILGLCENASDMKSYAILGISSESGKHSQEYVTDVISEGVDSMQIGAVAVYRAALQALSDAEYNCPARVGGNLSAPDIKATMSIARGNELSNDGICSYINRRGHIVTWGDHTAAFNGGSVTDERGRFENTSRVLRMICNRFIVKYENAVDTPMTVQMRNDIIAEQTLYMQSLKAQGAIIGEPRCTFELIDNPADELALGHFVWQIDATTAVPAKYLKAKVRYTSEGLSVYTAE